MIFFWFFALKTIKKISITKIKNFPEFSSIDEKKCLWNAQFFVGGAGLLDIIQNPAFIFISKTATSNVITAIETVIIQTDVHRHNVPERYKK